MVNLQLKMLPDLIGSVVRNMSRLIGVGGCLRHEDGAVEDPSTTKLSNNGHRIFYGQIMVKHGATGADLSTPFLDVGLAMQHAETGVTRCPKWSNFHEVVKMLNNARDGSDVVGHMVVWQANIGL